MARTESGGGFDPSRPKRSEVRAEQLAFDRDNVGASQDRKSESIARELAEDEADWITGLNDGGHVNQVIDENEPAYQKWIADHNKPKVEESDNMSGEYGTPDGAAEWKRGQSSLLKKEQIGENPDGSPIYNQGFDVKTTGRFSEEVAKPEEKAELASSAEQISGIADDFDSEGGSFSMYQYGGEAAKGTDVKPEQPSALAEQTPKVEESSSSISSGEQQHEQGVADAENAAYEENEQREAAKNQEPQDGVNETDNVEKIKQPYGDSSSVLHNEKRNVKNPDDGAAANGGELSGGQENSGKEPGDQANASAEVANDESQHSVAVEAQPQLEHDPSLTKEEAEKLNQAEGRTDNGSAEAEVEQADGQANSENKSEIEQLREEVNELKQELSKLQTEAATNPSLWAKVKSLALQLGRFVFNLIGLGAPDSSELAEVAQDVQEKIQTTEDEAEKSAKQIANERMVRLDAIRKPYQDKFDFYRNNAEVTKHLERYDFEVIGKTMNGLTEAIFQVGDIDEKNARLSSEILQQKQSLSLENNPEQANVLRAKIDELEKAQAANQEAKQKWNEVLDQEMKHWDELMRHLDELANHHADNANKLRGLARKIGLAVPRDQFYFTQDGQLGDKIEDMIKREAEQKIINDRAMNAPEAQSQNAAVAEQYSEQLDEPEFINPGVAGQSEAKQPEISEVPSSESGVSRAAA